MSPTEVFRLLLSIAMAPLVFGVGRRLSLRRARVPVAVAYAATVFAYLMAVVEHLAAPELFDALQSVGYAVTAIAVLVAALGARRDVLDVTGGA
ncbi:MAG TPA: hypothetical protein VF902_01155 [Coriobacteriia bacterium]